MNRVNQIYEDDIAIRLVLIADTDKLNLNTQADLMRAERAVRRRPVLRRDPHRHTAPRSSARGS